MSAAETAKAAAMPDKIDLPRYSKGRRPSFFDDGAIDHLLAMVIELSAELSVVYGKVDRLERFLLDAGTIDPAALDAFELTPEALAEQDEWRNLFIERLYSSLRQHVSSTTTDK